MHQKRTHLITILFLLFSLSSFAQTNMGAIKGFVYDKKSGEPMIYTTVRLLGTKYGAQTDVNGFYSITQIPPGSYTLFTTQIGYDTASVEVTVKAGDVISKKLSIKEEGVALKGVEINARKTEKITHVNAGVTTIAPRDIKLLPSVGGEPDVSQYLQVVPGVVFTGDQGGQLYIRGGSPTQTGISLDGVTIYNPFHSIGLYSVFETETIRSVDVQTAGFNAEHGNRTSAVMDIHTIDGNKNHVSGLVSVSPIMAHAMLNGPLIKAKKDDGTSVTYVLSAKSSYLDQTSKSLYGGFGEQFKSGLPYSFNDLYGKVTVSTENGSKVNFFGFNFDDRAKLLNDASGIPEADFHWQAKGAGATFIVSPPGSSTLIDGKFAYSRYDISETQSGGDATPPQASSISGFEAGINFTNFLPGYSEIKYGLEVDGYNTALTYYNGQDSNSLNRQNTVAAGYVMWRKDIGDKLVIEPSLRIQYYSEISVLSPEPRLGLKYNLSQNVRLKAAGGLYSQDIISTRKNTDIVNFFTGFLLSPDQTITDPNGNKISSNLQTAYHIMGGIEVDINKVELNLEPWYKDFSKNITLNNAKKLPSDPDFVAGTAKAYGIDLSAKYNYNRIYLWGVVSYQNVNYTSLGPDNTVQTYPAPFDRRWNISLLGSYNFGKKNNWDFSVHYNFGSPFPFTLTEGFYEQPGVQSTIGGNNLTSNGNISIIPSNKLDDGRLSYYHRLDVSVKRTFRISNRSNIDATASVTNVYDRNNIFYVNRLDAVHVYQLPLFPSLSLAWRF